MFRQAAVTISLAVAVTACGGSPPAEPRTDPPARATAEMPEAEPLGCDLPWESMQQVATCGEAAYEEASAEGNSIDIVVDADDPATIAASLAQAYLLHRNDAEEIVVWAYSSAEAANEGGFDRGVVSDQGMEGENLVFEVCTGWEPLDGPGDLCTERTEFTIERQSP